MDVYNLGVNCNHGKLQAKRSDFYVTLEKNLESPAEFTVPLNDADMK